MFIKKKAKKVKINVVGKKYKTKLNTFHSNKHKAHKYSKFKKPKLKTPSGVVTKRQGGGTLIASRPIFSQDSKYIYVNCGWGLRVFSVKTGECIRMFDAFCRNEEVVSALLHNNCPTAVTSNGTFIAWDGKTGKISSKYKINLPKTIKVTNAYLIPSLFKAPNEDLCLTQHDELYNQISINFYNPSNGLRFDRHPLNGTIVSNLNIKHNLSFGGKSSKIIIASISSNGFNVYSLDGKESWTNVKTSGARKWTCIRCHPTDSIVAVGDSIGRVLVYHYPGKQVPGVYHWHTLPCQDIAFSPAGSSMFSGGGENVLVKWNLENPHSRSFLPRLSSEIVHINVSPDNQLVALSTLDNAIQVVEPPIRLKCVLQQLAWGFLPTKYTKLFPAGLTFDPRTRAIALNGRPGYLQFYSPSTEAILFSVDIVSQNYITQEKDKVIMNTEVTHVAISSDGAWLATMETRCDPPLTMELRLKLWQYSSKIKNFTQNTSVEFPHDGEATAILFQPCSKKITNDDKINLDYLLATTGADKKFRFWTPRDLDSIYRKGISWGCDNTCSYRDLDCGHASFSEDGSLIAVGFGSSLTLWDVECVQLKESLTNGNENIKLIAFGMRECCHLLVSTTENMLFVWNLLTLRLSWKVPVQVNILTIDPCSTYIAAFTSENKMFVFTPLLMEPVYTTQVCDRSGHALSSVFVPREIAFLEGPHWLQYSLLYFIDSNQELICFESEEESGEVSMLKLAHDNNPGTLFSTLIAAQQTSEVKSAQASQGETKHFGVLGESAVAQLLQAPAHTMPPVSLLCSSLLQSLVSSKKTYGKKEKSDNGDSQSEEENEETDSSSSDVDSEDNSTKEVLTTSIPNIALSDEELSPLDQLKSSIDISDKPSNSSQTLNISELLQNVDNDDRLFIFDS